MKSGVTISLTPQTRGGPFVFWDDLGAACAKAAALGFDAIEIFAPSAGALTADVVRPLVQSQGLKVASVGSGAGWVVHKLTLTSPDSAVRAAAADFIRSIVEAGAALGAPTVVGSMQGRWSDGVTRPQAMEFLAEALNDLGAHAESLGAPLIFEPLNRYETNLVNTLAEGVSLLKSLKTSNVKLLADLFHMNIEEVDVAAALRGAGGAVGHVHLADSNRRPAGEGHTDFAAVASALRDIGYDGYVSAECLPWPDPDAAAAKTIESYRRYFK